MTTSAVSALSAQPLDSDLNSDSLLICKDRSHKPIDNCHQLCHQVNFKSGFTSDNATNMLSNNTTNINRTDGKSESTKLSSDLMATQLNNNDIKISVNSNESQSVLKSSPNKNDKIKDCIQQTVSEKTKKRIAAIVNEIEEFNDIEKLLLYIQLPNGSAQEVDPLKQKGPGNPFGKKADVEVAQTYTWIQSHLEEDPTVSLPKQEVYEEYKVFCDANKFEPLCVADFGKAMKHVFPKVKPRRLGQRGNSKYCYSGLRKKLNIEAPELPILDTSSYESKKNHLNWDLERNGVLMDESLAETEVIITWATKLLDRSFDSIPDLAQYLINTNSVDINLSDRISLKSNDEKQSLRTNSKSANSSRRRDVQNQLQRKIHEKEALKEQKRKSDLNNKAIESIKTVQICFPKGVRKNRKNSLSKGDELDSTVSTGSLLTALPIKTEPEIEVSTNFSSNQLIQNNIIQNKVAIPRTVTPSRMSQPSISPAISTSIILVPTAAAVRLASPQSALVTESTATTASIPTITSPIKPNTASKYKRIQPKPVNISRSDSESAVCAKNSNEMSETFNTIAKRRHSVSVPFSKDTKLKPIESFGDKQIQSKRQIEERESSTLSSKKRHIDSINAIVSNSTNSSGFDDANSSNSLSPISREELQTITSSVDTICTNDIRIHELESEALMDYFNPNSVSNKEQWDINSGTQTAKLSQLRKLLENHLPNAVNKTGPQRLGENVALEGYSELREALLRKNLNNSVQTYGGLKTTSKSEQKCSVSLSGSLKLCPKNQLEGMVSSTDLEDLSSLSEATKGQSLSSNGDYFSNQSNETKNGFQHSVNLQVPSVPPSPTARRRAFNFQPISPRNTPTIPENCAIDTIGFNGFNYNSNTLSSSPQYRLNQQTVGVGPSQPSSEANSPFVSPRSTPVTPITPVTPLPLSRSRHNSGQSSYSTLRQTPQTNFDSGVSSISNSPFISPQSTPLPISRVRAGTGGMQRSISRARHSSGPGGPITLNGMTASLLCNRSNSLSPMIGETFTNGTHGLSHSLPLSDFNSQFSFGSNVNSLTLKSQTPNSPLSPMSVFHNSDINGLTSDSMNGSSDMSYQECEPLQQKDWPSNRVKNMKNNGLVAIRQRHASNPYITPSTPPTNSEPFSREIYSYLKNSGNERNDTEIQNHKTFLINRCQSVPVAAINSNMGFIPKIGNSLSETTSIELENQLLDESTTISKSYPATPICGQQFQFPPSPPSSTKQQMAFSGDDIISGNVLQSGQDLMVSGVQLRDNNVWNTTIASTQHNNENDLMTINVNSIGPNSSNARRNLNDLLAEPPDDLQTTLEDLRDCDNDFSKFAQQLELEANDCTYDDLN